MEINNGIIIDGVLHELKETKRNDCSKCSLRDLCQNEFGNACLCWINLYEVLAKSPENACVRYHKRTGCFVNKYNPNNITQHSERLSRFKVCIGKKVMYFD